MRPSFFPTIRAPLLRAALLWCVFTVVSQAVGDAQAVAAARHDAGDARILFHRKDPAGDDHGDGTLAYPGDAVFAPYKDLLDLTAFTVVRDGRNTHFDLQFGALANPFGAPEGFYHPRIDIYIHAGKHRGATSPLREGPGVRFHPSYPWHVWIRGGPFGESAVFTWEDPPDAPGRSEGVFTRALSDDRSVRISVANQLLPDDPSGWRYYVLVGSFDGFGLDGYRGVGDAASLWLLRGPKPGSPVRVMDILAPGWGPRRQEAQLAAKGGEPPVILPVGRADYRPLVWIAIGLIVLGTALARKTTKRRPRTWGRR